MRPSFIVAGAQKSGTTSLFRYLMQHPDVREPVSKEVHYFDFNFARGDAWYEAHFPRLTDSGSATDARQVTGEATPFYMCHPAVPMRIRQYSPQTKIIMLLRDPVYRAISHYQHECARFREDRDISTAFIDEMRLIDSFDLNDESLYDENGAIHRKGYLARGMYAIFLRRWFEYFPREQMLVIPSQRLFAETGTVLDEVQRFICVKHRNLDSSDVHFAAKFRTEVPADLLQQCREFFIEPNLALSSMLGGDWNWSA